MPYEVKGKCIYKIDSGTKMEKEANKHAKKLEMNEGNKILIKRLIRENLGF